MQLNAEASTSGLPSSLCNLDERNEDARTRSWNKLIPPFEFLYPTKPALSNPMLGRKEHITRIDLRDDDRIATMPKPWPEASSSIRSTVAHDISPVRVEEHATTNSKEHQGETDHRSGSGKSERNPSRSSAIPQAYHSMLAGAGAGLVSSVVTCPLDVVKTRLQAQVSRKGAADYEGVKETINRIWKSAGVRGLYRGLGPTVLGYLPTWGIYFSVYDQIKDSLTPDGKSTRAGPLRSCADVEQ